MNIAFYGPMCSGKTYLAKFLVENYGYEKVGFADKLKEVAADLFGIDPNDLETRYHITQPKKANCPGKSAFYV